MADRARSAAGGPAWLAPTCPLTAQGRAGHIDGLAGDGHRQGMPSHRPLTAPEAAEIQGALDAACRALTVSAAASPDALVEAVRDYLDGLRTGRRRTRKAPSALAVELGALWGAQVVRALGWAWASVEHAEGEAYFAVVSPDAGLVAYPLHFLNGQLADPARANTTLLLFNMLVGGNVPPTAPGQYVSVG